MLIGESLVAHLAFTYGNNAITVNRNWRCIAVHSAAGVVTITTDDDTPEVDLDVDLTTTPNGNVSAALNPILSLRRTGANTYELSTSIAIAVAADPAANTIHRCTIKRVDTV